MRNTLISVVPGLVLTGFAAIGILPGHDQTVAATLATREPILYVHLFDEVNLPADARTIFIAEAEGGLRTAGVRSIWLDCPVGPSLDTPGGCVAELTGATVSIRILPRKMIGRDLALGYSLAGPTGGTYSAICYPAVERAARIAQMAVPKLLALATLHEIGHLLLGSNAHWPWGIMNPFWEAGRIDEIMKRGPLFTKAQSKLLRARIASRASAAERH
jgi:hypothetical protein